MDSRDCLSVLSLSNLLAERTTLAPLLARISANVTPSPEEAQVIMAVMFFINNLIGLVAITRDRQGWVEFLGEENNAGENRANV